MRNRKEILCAEAEDLECPKGFLIGRKEARRKMRIQEPLI